MSRHSSNSDRAIEDYFLRQEFQLDYQPIFSLEQQQIYGFETLLHLRPNRAQNYPADFISLIEETSLRNPLALWTLREACVQANHWQRQDRAAAISVSINVSLRQLRQRDVLIKQLESTLSETGLCPSRIQLEIPGTISYQTKLLQDALTALKTLGIQLYLDDFIPIPKNLELLSQMPVDGLKLRCTPSEELETAIDVLAPVLQLGEDLGILLIAKGIETPAQLSTLESCGFRYGQGFLFAKPMNSWDASALVSTIPQAVEFDLVSYVAIMSKLSHYLRHFLGRVVAKYWRETKPDKAWLAALKPLSTGDIVIIDDGISELVDLLQQQDLRQWVQDCLRSCHRIFPSLAQMVGHSGLTPIEQELLGFSKLFG